MHALPEILGAACAFAVFAPAQCLDSFSTHSAEWLVLRVREACKDPLERFKTRRSILPDEYEVLAIVPLGYPAQSSVWPSRREIHEFCHEERFS
jgi:hypothetical protein